jgi:hypothetical protein
MLVLVSAGGKSGLEHAYKLLYPGLVRAFAIYGCELYDKTLYCFERVAGRSYIFIRPTANRLFV